MNLTFAILVFSISTIAIAFAGTYLSKVSDQLADLTGMGEALFGAIFLGGSTSLPGIITSVVAAHNGHPQLAVSNAIGGIAAQTLFLAIADITYKRINLEHAAASFANLMQGLLLIGLLALVLTGISSPEVSFFHIHPFSVLLIIVYILGLRTISKAKDNPMWKPMKTKATVIDIPKKENLEQLSRGKVIFKFVVLAIIVAVAGYFVAKSGIAIADKTGLSEGFVGALLTAIVTSFPELIVSIAAVRQRALTLAVGNIIGGNTFDVLFIAFADVAYLEGSILHAISGQQVFILALTILMSATLILGMLQREKQGMAKIGWESFLIMMIYILGNAFIFFW